MDRSGKSFKDHMVERAGRFIYLPTFKPLNVLTFKHFFFLLRRPFYLFTFNFLLSDRANF
jgi:hypothetical protein